VTYSLEKGVVVESEVLDGAPLDLERKDEEEDFLFLFFYIALSTVSLGGNTIP
jgi:hypothetical protein